MNEKSVKTKMQKTVCCTVVALIMCCLVSTSQASGIQQDENHPVEKHAGISLSQDLKVILQEEMNGIEDGMKQIITALSAGNWETIAMIARKLRDSFILKQKLTQNQLKELHHSLPSEFVEIDQYFHSTAGKLVHAAKQRDGELVNFYFSQLNSKCIQCHAKYASERFPGLKSTLQGEGEQH